MRQYGQIISILLLCLARSSFEEHVKVGEEKQFTLLSGSNSLLRFPVRDDGSFPLLICDGIKSGEQDCKIHLVNPLTPEVVYPLKFTTGVGVNPVLLDLNLNETTAYCLLIEPPLGSENVERNVVYGFAHDLSSNKTIKLALPSDLIYEQYIGASFHDNMAEVVVRDHLICGNSTVCKLVLNIQGQFIVKPVSFPVDYDRVDTYPRVSMDPGLFILGAVKHPKIQQAVYIEPNGGTTVMNITIPRSYAMMFSDTGGLYGYCMGPWLQSEVRKTLDCTSFDWRSKSTVATNITITWDFGDYVLSRVVSYANLGNSRFLLTTLDCRTNGELECRRAQVVTVDSHGNLLESTPVFGELMCQNTGWSIHSYIAEVGDQLCIYILCENYILHPPPAHLYTKCFLKSIL